LAINGGGYWLLTHSFDTVVLGALSGRIGNLCDSVVSRTGQFLFPCRLVRYFFNSILFFRAHQGVCVIVAHKPKNRTATYERLARQMPANIRPSYTYLPADWRSPYTKPMRSTQCQIRTTLVPHILAQMDSYTTSRTRLASMIILWTTTRNKYHTTMYQLNVI
jgi:hypothetical protein